MQEKQNQDGALLRDFREGKISEPELYHVIHQLGRAHLVESQPDREPFLTNAKPSLRSIALHVLVLHFHAQEHWQTSVDFLLHDPDIACQREGAAALAWLKRGTQDQRTLEVLAQVVRNKEQEMSVREAAYSAMREIFLYDSEEQWNLLDLDFDLQRDADWDWVDSYVQSEAW